MLIELTLASTNRPVADDRTVQNRQFPAAFGTSIALHLRMTTASRDGNAGPGMGDSYTPGEIIISEVHRTVYRATAGSDRQSAAGLALVIDTAQAIDSLSGHAGARFRRYREASFLNDPYLAGIVRVGRIATAPGAPDAPGSVPQGAPYLLMECPGEILSRYLEPRRNRPAPPVAELLRIATGVLRGLAYLHSQNLVYCALNPNSVWRVGGGWKLSDFSQLRLPGTESLDIARRLLTQADISAPPEAYYGQVSTAWDVWSFGALLGRIAHPPAKRTPGDPTPAPVGKFPAEIEELIAACLNPDPLARPAVAALLVAFEGAGEVVALDAATLDAATLDAAALDAEIPEPAIAQAALPAAPVQLAPAPSAPAVNPLRKMAAILAIAAVLLAAFLIALHFFPRSPNPSIARTYAHPSTPAPLAAATPQIAPQVPTLPPQITPAPAPQLSAKPAVLKPQPRQQIARVMQQWARAGRDRDLAAQMRFYAPQLDSYYGADHVTAAELAGRKRRAFFEIGPVRQFAVSNLHFDRLTASSAVVSFDKHWALGPGGALAGTALDQVVLQRIGNAWKITSERETQPSPNSPRPSPIF